MTTRTENEAGPLVLVADDDPDILQLVSLHLRKAGYAVVTATDGRQALDTVRERRPDLAIVDVRMPEIDGLELIRQIRADQRTSRMLLIALSARVREANIAEGFEAGADEYMEKPFSGKQLLALVEAKLPTTPAACPGSPS
jgi:DNA-binding response OmpR family regulator